MDLKVKGTREMKKLLVAISAAMAGLAACAATTITVDNVRQRWPWNNKVDITYTIGGDDATVDKVCRVVITTVVGGVTYTAYDGVPNENVLPGTHTVTWENPPAGVKCEDCKMTAKFYTVAVPSGNDYMIVDLLTGAVSYEGRFANGDSFGGGLIHAMRKWPDDPQQQIEFAVAASCLKQATEYDFNLCSEKEVLALVGGNASGRVQR